MWQCHCLSSVHWGLTLWPVKGCLVWHGETSSFKWTQFVWYKVICTLILLHFESLLCFWSNWCSPRDPDGQKSSALAFQSVPDAVLFGEGCVSLHSGQVDGAASGLWITVLPGFVYTYCPSQQNISAWVACKQQEFIASDSRGWKSDIRVLTWWKGLSCLEPLLRGTDPTDEGSTLMI